MACRTTRKLPSRSYQEQPCEYLERIFVDAKPALIGSIEKGNPTCQTCRDDVTVESTRDQLASIRCKNALKIVILDREKREKERETRSKGWIREERRKMGATKFLLGSAVLGLLWSCLFKGALTNSTSRCDYPPCYCDHHGRLTCDCKDEGEVCSPINVIKPSDITPHESAYRIFSIFQSAKFLRNVPTSLLGYEMIRSF